MIALKGKNEYNHSTTKKMIEIRMIQEEAKQWR